MPRYVYHCKSCDGHFQVWHGMKEMQESCQLCEGADLMRVPQMPSIKTTDFNEEKKTGSLTKEYIKDNKELLKQMKKEAGSHFYDD